MYGLLLENLAEYIRTEYGEEKWEEIRRLAKVDQPTFSSHRVYSDTLIPRLAQKATKVLGVSEQDLFESLGRAFVEFVSQYGYDRVLSILGRHMRDFLNGLDNLHEYLKFSYPRMKAPSFFVENENQFGLILHYRSKRKGFVYYTMGQIKAVGRRFYKTDVNIHIVKEELLFDTVHVTFQLHFENTAYLQSPKSEFLLERLHPVQSQLFFEIFPFCVVFGSDMVIRNIGHSLQAIMPNLVGKKITEKFNLARPLIDFTWATVLRRTNNIFELVTLESLRKSRSQETLGLEVETNLQFADESCDSDTDCSDEPHASCLSLKGQMLYMEEWKSIIFLGTPIMQDLDSMVKAGLYINDLSMHDFSRDLMLAGTQQSVELKLALDQEQQKSKRLENSMRKLDEEMKRTDELLYQMIPKAVADRLRKGTPAVNTCEVFDTVTVLFSDVVTFTQICTRISPMEVVSLLNSMYSIFDKLTSRHHVYKKIGQNLKFFSGLIFLANFPYVCPPLYASQLETLLHVLNGEHIRKISQEYKTRKEFSKEFQILADFLVETIGDAYMVVSGAPEKKANHAQKVCNMALDMMQGIKGLKDPSTGDSIRIRIGIHSGTVVAGVVGLKMPRYCLFGDTVNTASRMESTSEPMKIHISESTRTLLGGNAYEISLRGTISIKGKGNMKTYWLIKQFQANRSPDSNEGTENHLGELNGDLAFLQRSRSSSPEGRFSPSNRSLYSPVTFDEVARHRQVSPIRQHANTWNEATLRERDTAFVTNVLNGTPGLNHATSTSISKDAVPLSYCNRSPSFHGRENNRFSSVDLKLKSLKFDAVKTESPQTPNGQSKKSQESGDLKPTAILFPCLHRNVQPLMPKTEQNPMEESSNKIDSLDVSGLQWNLCRQNIMPKKREVMKSNYCNLL